MADENTNIQQPGEEVTPENLGVTFEDILPWGSEGGDTGLSARLKLKRNFDKIQTRFNVDQALYLSKINDDTAQGFIRFIRGLQVGERFVTGLLGEGGIFRKEADGTTYIEADKLYIRMKAYFDSVVIREYKHSAGNSIASPAGARCCRVDWIDASGNSLRQTSENLSKAVLFRCYFRGSDGEDEVRNNFVVGDQAYCHVTTVETEDDSPEAKGLNQKHYWRLVVGRNPHGTLTDNGEHWIDLSNRATETLTIGGQTYTHAGYQSGSDIPVAKDDIIQLGNIYDTDRMGAIIEFVTGADSPSYQIFQDINDFNLNGKNYIALGYSTQTGRAYLNVYGDTFIGDPEESTYIRYNAQTKKLDVKATVTFVSPTTHEDTTIEDFAAAVTSDINTIQNQIDGTIETWFYNGVPGDSTLPESQWKAIDEAAGNNNERLKHLGDMYYDNQTGYAYRYTNQGTEKVPQFVWTPISDSAVVKALADAAKAQDTADHKRRVFLTTPTPPYDAGDMWVNAVWPESGELQGSTYNNDILRCKTARTSTQSFSINDWGLASKYTDDSVFNAYINQILNGSGASGDSATVANAIRVIKSALNDATVIDGGLVLTSLINLRSNSKTWAGISGIYNEEETGTGYKGHGIAAWYGGAMVDKEVTTTATDYAKSLFRFDGSGYVANGNIAWDSTGLTTLNVSSVSADTIKLGGKGVATQDWVKQNYISIAYFDRLFRAYNGNNIVQHNDVESTIDNIKAMFGFWTDAYVSALSKGTGGGDMVLAEPLQSINSANLGAPTTANVGIIWDGSKWVYGSTGGGGTVTAVKVGTTTYNPSSGVVSLPAYLPLDGGVMSNTNLVANLNAELLNGLSSNDFGRRYTDTINANSGVKISFTNNRYGAIVSVRGGSGDYRLLLLGNGYGVSSSRNHWICLIKGSGIDWCINAEDTRTIEVFNHHPDSVISVSVLLISVGLVTFSEISALSQPAISEVVALTSQIPTNNNQLTNGAGYITSSDSITGNAGSATKLQTARTIWGRKFDGTADVSGAIDDATTISASSNVSVGGTLGVTGASTLTGLLTANGGIVIPSGKTLKIGDAVLSWDSTNQGIKITKGLYSETFISALGTGSSSGTATTLATLADVNVTGAKNDDVLTYNSTTKKWEAKAVQTGTDMATVWAELGASTTNQINASHLTNALGSYAQKTELAKYLPLTAGSDNRITGYLYFSHPVTTGSTYIQTDNRIYYTTPDSIDEILLRARVRNNGTNNYYRVYAITPFSSITSHDVAAGTQGYTTLSLGNDTLSSAENSRCGRIILYGMSDADTTAVRYGVIAPTVFTANRTYTLPNASGTIALTSDLGGYLPLTGGTLTGELNVVGNVKATTFIGALQGNADSATTASKLSVVSKTAWGQTYWTSGGIPTTISGNMTNVGSIAMGGAITGATTISASSNVSVGGTLSVTGLLTASGGITIPSGKTLTIGDAVLSWDATNQGIKITKGLYSETFISAYGRGSDSGAATSLSSLSDVNISGVANGMSLVYRSGIWRAETISSGTSGDYLPLSGGTMTGDIITPANDNLGIRPASNNYGQIGTSSYKFYRMYASNMYASTFYGELDGTISDETRGSFITSNNEFNFVPQVYTKDDLHFNYKAANGELCNRTITTYCFDDGKKNTLCSITSSGASAGSDIRKKDVKEYFRLRLDDIVSAPLIRFSWKKMNDKSLQVGSIAQYWKDVLPESVIEGTDGYLFMNDAKVALACSISLASNVQDHERRIAELEKENERLRTEIEQLKIA